ncbi:F-box domain containing protein [Pandoravirus macleodensis]|uniref:F-box domain containing protein n=1 Tax=Pandoravirus macleodensis TaxID=2107707 RepID=A0A2U7UEK2_9VIRU|nr:F-box domain containing protein [Pandoravirus macleodensis]AVK76901.1 F-box domain containing protein [Pandoravirus macleodensis]
MALLSTTAATASPPSSPSPSPPLSAFGSEAGADNVAYRRPTTRPSAKRSHTEESDGGDRTKPKGAVPSKRRRLSRLLRYRSAKPLAAASRCTDATADAVAESGGAPDWGTLPVELVSLILNGCDARDNAFLHPRWRTIARAVCRVWRNVVENPSASDAARITPQLADPHPSLRHLWSRGRLLCASAIAERLRCEGALTPEAVVAWASHQGRTPAGPFLTAASLVASARPDAVAYAFSKHLSRAAISSLRSWLRCAANRTRDTVLRPPTAMAVATEAGLSEGSSPDGWWAAPCAGGLAVRPWEGMRRVVGGCAHAAFAGLLLRVAARHASIDALDMLLTVSDPPCGVADAAFEAAAAGHAAFVVRMLMLVAAAGDRARAAVVCYQAWLGAAAGGHTRVMHALLDAESGRGTLATALWRGRCLADGSPRHPRTASHVALAHDRAGYFEVLRDRESTADKEPLWFAKTYLAEALRVGALNVARWLTTEGQINPVGSISTMSSTTMTTTHQMATAQADNKGNDNDNHDDVVDDVDVDVDDDDDVVDDNSDNKGSNDSNNSTAGADCLCALGSRAIVEVVVDGRGSRECARRTILWMRDRLGAEPSAAALGVLVRSAHAFRWARTESAAARGRLSASRYARLLDLLVDVIKVWPHAAATEIERDDEDEQEDMAADIDPYYMCLARDGGGHAYGACVVRLLVERVSHGRIAGDRYDRRHARRGALSALDRIATIVVTEQRDNVGPRGITNSSSSPSPSTHSAIVDPWAVAAARVTAEIAVVDRTGRSPMRSIDALLGMATIACRCLLSATVEAAISSEGTQLPAVVFGLANRMSEKGISLDDDRARLWRRWCRLPAERNSDGNEFDCIGGWAERIATHTVFT